MTRRSADVLRSLARKLKRKLIPGGLILLYHRVEQLDADPQKLGVTPDNFRKQLEVLRKYAKLISLEEMIRHLAAGQVPRRAVAITFDDGYVDNLEKAKPILSQFEAPATFFISSGYINSKREFWFDELERLFLSPGSLPRLLSIEAGGRRYRFELGEDADYSPSDAKGNASWTTHTAPPTSRHRIYDELCSVLRTLSVATRERVLDNLREWAGDNGDARAGYRAMTSTEVMELSNSGLCEVGAHSVNHPRLASLPASEQEIEIYDSKRQLEMFVGRSVSSFSYPFGGGDDYSPKTTNLVKDAGFQHACSNFEGRVVARTDRFQLPRLLVRNWPESEFIEHFRQLF